MIGLPELIALNNRPQTRILDNFNRDSSFCESRSGFVLHSAIHRSTSFVSKEEHPDSYFAASYWLRQGQEAVNAYVPAIVGGESLETAERAAFGATRPEWTIRHIPAAGKNGSAFYEATRKSGRMKECQAAFTLRHLHAKTGKGDA